jgi:hypothetical protein
MLDQHVGTRAAEDGVEAADEGGMGERTQRLHLEPEVAQRLLVLRLVGTQDLGDAEGIKVLVPDQADLIAVAAPDRLQHEPPRAQLLALLEVPACVVAHRPKGKSTDRGLASRNGLDFRADPHRRRAIPG